jgi:hypothetical protein
MVSSEGSQYRVDPTGLAKRQMRELAINAPSPRERQEVLDALKGIIEELQTRPLEWGEPEHRTRRRGGSFTTALKAHFSSDTPLSRWTSSCGC